MSHQLYWILFLGAVPVPMMAQQYSMPTREGLRFQIEHQLITEETKPEPVSCNSGAGRYYKILKKWVKIVEFNYREEKQLTKQEEWTETDEQNFDRQYNLDHRKKLDSLLASGNYSPEDPYQLANEYLDHFMLNEWNSQDYSICNSDCEKAYLECLINWSLDDLEEVNREIRFETTNSFLNEKDTLPNEVDISLSLVYEVEAWVYFFVKCSCSFDPSWMMLNMPQDYIAPPWNHIDLTNEIMKPGYPFVAARVSKFPWIPVIGGAVAGGTVTYFLTRNHDDNPSDCSFTASAQSNGTTCGLPNGSISIQVSPAGDYSYAWAHGATGSFITEIPAGTYTATVSRTGTSCTEMITTTIDNQNPFFDATISTQPSVCDGETGSALVAPVPDGAYTYLWSNGTTTQNQANLAAGNYMVTISAGGMCEKSFPVQIGTAPFEPSVTFNTTPATCGGADGAAMITVDPIDQYTYAWSNGLSGNQVSGLAAGAYTVTVSKPGTTCSYETGVVINELPASFSISVSSTLAGCGLSDGTATATIDPEGIYDYTWSDGQTGAQISGLAAGDYTVTVTVPGSDCSKEASVTIGAEPFPYQASFTTTPSHCGASDGSAGVMVTPQGEFGYQWSNGGSAAEVTALSAGSYTVTVTDIVTSCSESFSVTIEEIPAEIILSFTTTPAGCGVSNGTATVMADPPGAYTYLWSNGNTTPQISGVSSGTYSVTVTIMGSMCFNSSTIEVGQAGGGFTASFMTANADCGLKNGTASIMVDPPAEYTYEWSNLETGPELQQVTSGTYSVTVTDVNLCTEEFSVTVGEDPAEFITVTGTTPGICTGGGEVMFTLTTPGTGALIILVEGPSAPLSTSLSAGDYLLSAFLNVIPGTYTFTVYDEITGAMCTEILSVEVIDNTPPLVTNDDFYITPGGQSVFENALNNDSGSGILMTDVTNEFGGTVTFNSSGEFTFVPDPGFSGEASFTYQVTDACGTTGTAVVTIFVEQTICDFEADFETIPASCGLEDGSITAMAIGPGAYLYEWSNGDSGATISGVPAGPYSVTIMDVNLGCGLVFNVDLPANPADYIADIVITQPTCSEPGEIQFTAFTGSQNPLIMSVTHPDGSDVFFIEPGVILMSAYISIVPGNYSIEVSDSGAGQDCFEAFDVVINTPSSVEIQEGPIMPPTSPSAMDGVIAIEVITPGEVPYTVYLDGIPIFTTTENVFFIEGVGVGEYMVQIIDAAGCVSNLLIVIVPLPDIILSFGTGITNSNFVESNEQPAGLAQEGIWRSMLLVTLQYHIRGIHQELRMSYVNPVNQNHYGTGKGFLEMEYLADIKSYDLKKIRIALQGGLGVQYGNSNLQIDDPAHSGAYWLLRASTGSTIARKIKLEGSLSIRGWTEIDKPVIAFSASFPFTFEKSFFRHF